MPPLDDSDGTEQRRPCWRIHWQHTAPGFGRSPQRSDEPRAGRLLRVEPGDG